jgi:hypothetical protein
VKGRCPCSNKVYSNKIAVSVGHLVVSLSVFTWLVEGEVCVSQTLCFGHIIIITMSCCQCLQITKGWCKGQRIDSIWWRQHYHCVSCEYPVLTCYHTLSVMPSALCIPTREMLLSLLSRTLRSRLLANLQKCVQCAVGFCNVVMCICECAVGTQSMMDAAFVSLKAKFDIQVFFLYAKCQSCVVMAHQIKKLNLERNCSYWLANYLEI